MIAHNTDCDPAREPIPPYDFAAAFPASPAPAGEVPESARAEGVFLRDPASRPVPGRSRPTAVPAHSRQAPPPPPTSPPTADDPARHSELIALLLDSDLPITEIARELNTTVSAIAEALDSPVLAAVERTALTRARLKAAQAAHLAVDTLTNILYVHPETPRERETARKAAAAILRIASSPLGGEGAESSRRMRGLPPSPPGEKVPSLRGG